MCPQLDIETVEMQLLDKIDQNIATATENELFAGGYLRGHISLSAAKCEQQGYESFNDFKQMVEESLHDARHELTPQDQKLVQITWLDLIGNF